MTSHHLLEVTTLTSIKNITVTFSIHIYPYK